MESLRSIDRAAVRDRMWHRDPEGEAQWHRTEDARLRTELRRLDDESKAGHLTWLEWAKKKVALLDDHEARIRRREEENELSYIQSLHQESTFSNNAKSQIHQQHFILPQQHTSSDSIREQTMPIPHFSSEQAESNFNDADDKIPSHACFSISKDVKNIHGDLTGFPANMDHTDALAADLNKLHDLASIQELQLDVEQRKQEAELFVPRMRCIEERVGTAIRERNTAVQKRLQVLHSRENEVGEMQRRLSQLSSTLYSLTYSLRNHTNMLHDYSIDTSDSQRNSFKILTDTQPDDIQKGEMERKITEIEQQIAGMQRLISERIEILRSFGIFEDETTQQTPSKHKHDSLISATLGFQDTEFAIQSHLYYFPKASPHACFASLAATGLPQDVPRHMFYDRDFNKTLNYVIASESLHSIGNHTFKHRQFKNSSHSRIHKSGQKTYSYLHKGTNLKRHMRYETKHRKFCRKRKRRIYRNLFIHGFQRIKIAERSWRRRFYVINGTYGRDMIWTTSLSRHFLHTQDYIGIDPAKTLRLTRLGPPTMSKHVHQGRAYKMNEDYPALGF